MENVEERESGKEREKKKKKDHTWRRGGGAGVGTKKKSTYLLLPANKKEWSQEQLKDDFEEYVCSSSWIPWYSKWSQ